MSGSGRDDGLKNPMRFSIRNRTIDIEEKLRHPDFDEKRTTEIEIQDGQMYVHWEWADDKDTDYSDYTPESDGDSHAN